MKRFVYFCLVSVASLFASQSFADKVETIGIGRKNLSNSNNWIAIIGDSGTTGAVSSTEIKATFENLQGRLKKALSKDWQPTASENSLTRVFFSGSEVQNSWTRPFFYLTARVWTQVDFPESSFGYFVGQGLGVDPLDIILVGQNSLMVKTIPLQFSRIFQIHTKTLPPLVLISFTANDFCDPKLFSATSIRSHFQSALKKAWDESAPFLKAHPLGTKIVVLAPLDVSNILANTSIQERVIELEGQQGTVTCGQVRSDQLQSGIKSWVMRRTLSMMCPAITSPTSAPEERLKTLKAVQDVINELWKAQIQVLNQTYKNTQLRWQYLESIRHLEFEGSDVGNDCFHPSVRGHKKIAKEVLRALGR